MSWKGFIRPKLGRTTIGLLVVAAVWGGGWLLTQLLTLLQQFNRSFALMARPTAYRNSSPPEPSRLEELGLQARHLFEQNSDWLVGAIFSIATLLFFKAVVSCGLKWWGLNSQIDSTNEKSAVSNQLVGGLFGLAVFSALTLAWIQTFL